MADDSTNLPAVRQERVPVADIVPIFDTARFDHYGRIAAVLARSSFIHEGIAAGDAVANCFQLVELADRWKMSPFALGQSASVVHGKLMLEGKAIAAALQSNLGIELHHYFQGEWGSEDYRIYVTDTRLDEAQVEELRPHIKIANVKLVDGSVKEWATREKNSPNLKGNWKNQPDVQLGYRGDRTWTRVFRPSLIMGVLGDDEVDEFEHRRLTTSEPPARLTQGFTPSEAPRKPVEAKTPDPTPEPEEGLHAKAEAAQDAEFEDGKPAEDDQAKSDERQPEPQTSTQAEDVNEVRPTETASAPSVAPQPDSSASATDASGGSAAATSSPATTASPPSAGATPAVDEVYLLAGEGFDDAGRRATYKNGHGWSRITEKAAAKLKVYQTHAPQGGAPADEETVFISTPSNEGEKMDSPASPSDMDPTMATDIAAAASYLGAKQVVKPLGASLYAPEGAPYRAAVWDRCRDLNDQSQPQDDYLLMWLWMEFGAERGADIKARWPSFWRSGAYKSTTDEQKSMIVDLMNAREKVLG